MDPNSNFNLGFVPPTGNRSTNYQPHQYTYPCTWEGCDRMFVCPQNVDQHVREKHTGERPFACDHCFATFPRQGSLNRHIRDVHKIKVDGGRGKKRMVEDVGTLADNQPAQGFPIVPAHYQVQQLEQEPNVQFLNSIGGFSAYNTGDAKHKLENQQDPPPGYGPGTTQSLDQTDAMSALRHNPYYTTSAHKYVIDLDPSNTLLDPTLAADAVFDTDDFQFTAAKHQTPPVAQPEVCVICQTYFSTHARLAEHLHEHGMEPFSACACATCERRFRGGAGATGVEADASGHYGAQTSIQAGYADGEDWLIPPEELQALQLFNHNTQLFTGGAATDAYEDGLTPVTTMEAHEDGFPQEYHQP